MQSVITEKTLLQRLVNEAEKLSPHVLIKEFCHYTDFDSIYGTNSILYIGREMS